MKNAKQKTYRRLQRQSRQLWANSLRWSIVARPFVCVSLLLARYHCWFNIKIYTVTALQLFFRPLLLDLSSEMKPFLCLLLGFVASPLFAQWAPLSEPSAYALSGVINQGDTLVVTTYEADAKFFLSYDAGENWKNISNDMYVKFKPFGVRNGKVFSIDQHGGGVAVYENGQWHKRNNGFQEISGQGYRLYDFDLHENWTLVSNVKNGLAWLYLSKDDGLNWIPVSDVGLKQGYSAYYGKFLGNRIYSWGPNTLNNYIPEAYYSDDFGQTWKPLPVKGSVNQTVLVVGDSHAILKGQDAWYMHQGDSLIKAVGLPLNAGFRPLVEFGNRLFIANGGSTTWTSTNEGRNWVSVPQIPNSPFPYGIVKYKSLLLVPTNAELLASEDNGDTWHPFLGTGAFGVPLLAASEQHLYAANAGKDGFYRLDEATKQWLPRSKGIEKASGWFVRIKSDGPKVWAESWAGNFFSEDTGQTWKEPSTYVEKVEKIGSKYYGVNASGLLTVSEDGKNWTDPPAQATEKYAYDVIFGSGDKIYVASALGLLLSSKDGAATWDMVNSAMPDQVFRVVTDDPAKWYLAAAEGVYSSSNQGKTWIKFSNFSSVPVALLLHETRLIAGLGDGGVQYKDPIGSWKNGIGADAVRFGPYIGNGLEAVGKVLIATGEAGKIMVSTDKGSNWSLFNTGLDTTVNCAQTISIGNWLYTTCDNGLWRRPLSDLPAVSAATEPPVVDLFPPAPNPTTGRIQLSNVPPGTSLQVQVSDAGGRIAFSGDISNNGYVIDISAQPSGVYFIRTYDGKQWGISRVIKP